ncbi:hypothetical protein [Streptomyces paludis]|uniref:Calcium-binding protein n=1 Tax=Streptomyces paludis TaxID=2282738 RepID=A0A345HLU9_9ACTN|nr:hypothetical protein [Streptomyces paludis]AXG77673.1 hypothetical protein DVK44_08135 [Streptomyces paludis]
MRARHTVVVALAPLVLIGTVAPTVHADTAVGDTRITSVTVKPATGVGADLKTGVTVSLTATDNSGIDRVIGTKLTGPDGLVIPASSTTCKARSAITVQCRIFFPLWPKGTDPGNLRNSAAGAWRFTAKAVAVNGDSHRLSPGKLLHVKRHATLQSLEATPRPVGKGGKLTLSGRLQRANWDTNSWEGYAGRPVALQFRKSGTKKFKPVKTVTTDSAGRLHTTVTAKTTGSWRWRFTADTESTGAKSQHQRVVVRQQS